jgi:hypothetical protein
MSNLTLIIVVGVTIFGICLFYPTVIAFKRGVNGRWAIFLLNLFLGWTMLGWLLCLYLAMGPTDEEIQYEARRQRLAEDADRAILTMERRSREQLTH